MVPAEVQQQDGLGARGNVGQNVLRPDVQGAGIYVRQHQLGPGGAHGIARAHEADGGDDDLVALADAKQMHGGEQALTAAVCRQDVGLVRVQMGGILLLKLVHQLALAQPVGLKHLTDAGDFFLSQTRLKYIDHNCTSPFFNKSYSCSSSWQRSCELNIITSMMDRFGTNSFLNCGYSI